MGKYREVRNIIMEVLSDREWHKIDELQLHRNTKSGLEETI